MIKLCNEVIMTNICRPRFRKSSNYSMGEEFQEGG
jgi:hypothetical protein